MPFIDKINFKKEMEAIHRIKDASLDLYEACLAIKKAFATDGGRTFNTEEQQAFDLLNNAIALAEVK